jgi:hypothetical protein
MHHVPAAVPPTRRRIRLAVCIVAGFGHGNVTHEHTYQDQAGCSRRSDCPIPLVRGIACRAGRKACLPRARFPPIPCSARIGPQLAGHWPVHRHSDSPAPQNMAGSPGQQAPYDGQRRRIAESGRLRCAPGVPAFACRSANSGAIRSVVKNRVSAPPMDPHASSAQHPAATTAVQATATAVATAGHGEPGHVGHRSTLDD